MASKYRATNILTGEVIEGTADVLADKLRVSAQNVYSCATTSSCLMRTWKIEKAGKIIYQKKCRVCGAPFESEYKNTMYCSALCLGRAGSIIEQGIKNESSNKNQEPLAEDAVNAMQEDKTYGKYKAQQYLEEEKRKRIESLEKLYSTNKAFKYHVDKHMRSKGMTLENVLILPSINRVARMYAKGE